MLNYIKWELLNELKAKKYVLLFVAAIFFINIVTDPEGIFAFLFGLILICSMLMAYAYGTNKVLNSYKKQTFLLESMIPLSPKKILLSKYILAIIYNVFCAVVLLIGMQISLAKVDINLIETIMKELAHIDSDVKEMIFQFFVFLMSSSITFTSVITLLYIAFKSIVPKMGGASVIAWLTGIFCYSFVMEFINEMIGNSSSYDTILYIESLILLCVTAASYFLTSWFIENKLEIYN